MMMFLTILISLAMHLLHGGGQMPWRTIGANPDYDNDDDVDDDDDKDINDDSDDNDGEYNANDDGGGWRLSPEADLVWHQNQHQSRYQMNRNTADN